MANEFKAKNGLIAQGNITAEGDIVAQGDITAQGTVNLQGTLTASTISATTLFVTNEVWTVELVDAQVATFYAPYNMVIQNYDFPISATTITIYDDGASYTTGNTITIGSKVNVSASTATVVNLNTTR